MSADVRRLHHQNASTREEEYVRKEKTNLNLEYSARKKHIMRNEKSDTNDCFFLILWEFGGRFLWREGTHFETCYQFYPACETTLEETTDSCRKDCCRFVRSEAQAVSIHTLIISTPSLRCATQLKPH
jgi:hypothetical protein